jgi:Xaa-Pro aminopeptidase
MENIRQRIEKLRREMQQNNMEAFLVTSPENIRYLSGFTGGRDAKLMVSHVKKYIITDSLISNRQPSNVPIGNWLKHPLPEQRAWSH